MSPDAACFCVDRGIWSALTVHGPTRVRMLDAFREQHSGPGHVPEVPPRDWYKREAALVTHLRKLRERAA